MSSLTKYLQKFTGGLDKFLETAGVIIMLGIGLVLGCWEVFTRYALGISHDWVEELLRLGNIFGTFLIAAILIKSDEHLRMDVVVYYWKGKKRLIATIVEDLAIIVMAFFIGWFGFQLLLSTREAGIVSPTVLKTPKWILQSSVFFGMAFIFIFGLERFIKDVHRLLKWKEKGV